MYIKYTDEFKDLKDFKDKIINLKDIHKIQQIFKVYINKIKVCIKQYLSIKDFDAINHLKFIKKEIKIILKDRLNYIKNNVQSIDNNYALNETILNGYNFITYKKKNALIDTIHRVESFFLHKEFIKHDHAELTDIKYIFDHLLIDQNHPAWNPSSNFYLSDKWLEHMTLTPHTTSNSSIILEWFKDRINKHKFQLNKFFSIGRVFWNDKHDATHWSSFFQVDFIIASIDVKFIDLLHVLYNFFWYILPSDHNDLKDNTLWIKFWSHYFPFTDCSIEAECFYKNTWVELCGGGLIKKDIKLWYGIDDNICILAAGIGIDRLAIIRYNMERIHSLYNM